MATVQSPPRKLKPVVTKPTVNLSTAGASNSKIPDTYVRAVSLGAGGKITVDMLLLRKKPERGQRLGGFRKTLEQTGIKIIASFDESLTRRIINKEVSLSKDFNQVSSAKQIVLNAANLSFPGVGSLNKRKDSRGKFFLEIPASVTFTDSRVNSENPQHLTILAFSFFRDLNEPIGSTKPYSSVGKISADTIFQNSSTSMETSVLVDQNDEVWVGDFYAAPDGSIRAGNSRPGNSGASTTRNAQKNRPTAQEVAEMLVDAPAMRARNTASDSDISLTVRSVPNSVIRDYRVFDKINTAVEGRIDAIEKLDEVIPEFKNSSAKFSDLYTSFDEQRRVKFLFAIDCREIYLENVKISGLIRKPEVFQRMMRQMRIKSLEVRRDNLNDDIKKKLIVSSGDSQPRNFLKETYSETNANDEIKKIATISEIYLGANASTISSLDQVRYFSVVDHEISEFTTGKFQYDIEIEFEDNTESYLVGRNKALKDALYELEDYISDASRHINLSSNRFVEGFTNASLTRKQDFLRGILTTYLDNLTSTLDVDITTQTELTRTLMNITYPNSGNADGLELLAKQIRSLIQYNERYLTKFNSLSSRKKDYESTTDHIKQEKYSFKVQKTFNNMEELYTIDCVNKTGASYLFNKGESSNEDTLATVNIADFQARVNQEATKFPNINTSAQISGLKKTIDFNPAANQSTFLTPIYIQTGDNIVDIKEGRTTAAQFDGIGAVISSRNIERKSSETDQRYYADATSTEDGLLTEVQKFLGFQSIQIVSNEELLNIRSNGQTVEDLAEEFEVDKFTGNNSLIDLQEKEESKYQDNTLSRKDKQKASIAQSLQVGLSLLSSKGAFGDIQNNQEKTSEQKSAAEKTNEKLNLKSSQNLIDTLTEEEIAGIPNQILSSLIEPPKAFFSSNPGEFVRDDVNNSEFNATYGSIVELEVLTGYGTSVKDPEFKSLTPDDVSSISDAALVRMVPYKNSDLGIDDQLNIPTFDEVFLLNSAATSLSPAADPGSAAMRVMSSTQATVVQPGPTMLDATDLAPRGEIVVDTGGTGTRLVGSGGTMRVVSTGVSDPESLTPERVTAVAGGTPPRSISAGTDESTGASRFYKRGTATVTLSDEILDMLDVPMATVPEFVGSTPANTNRTRITRCLASRIAFPPSSRDIPVVEMALAPTEATIDSLYGTLTMDTSTGVINNQYTPGGEFVRPNGDDYRGYYHIHPELGPMVGRFHTEEAHDRLTRLTRRQRRMREATQQAIEEAQAAAAAGELTVQNPTTVITGFNFNDDSDGDNDSTFVMTDEPAGRRSGIFDND